MVQKSVPSDGYNSCPTFSLNKKSLCEGIWTWDCYFSIEFFQPNLWQIPSNRTAPHWINNTQNCASQLLISKIINRDYLVITLPFEGWSIQGPFIIFKMLHILLYSKSGSNFGVSRKHLHMLMKLILQPSLHF